MKKMPCPVCGTDSPFEKRHPETDLYRCPECDLCFSDQNQIAAPEAYADDYYEDAHANWFKNPNLELFEAIYRVCEKAGSGASVLDIGCGKGELLKYLYRKNPRFRLTGIDLSYNPPTEGIAFIQGDALETDLGEEFDVVISLATIEHVTDIQAFTNGLSKLCRPNGSVIIMTLNDRSILYEMARRLNNFGIKGPFNRLYSKHHLSHFNVKSLRRLAEMNGMPVRETILHAIPLAAVDFEAGSPLARAVSMTGVRIAFLLGKMTGRTYLQTIICDNRKPDSAAVAAERAVSGRQG